MKGKVALKEALSCWRQKKEAMVWDMALPKAAATKFEGMATFQTDGGKYYLTLRENRDDPEKGLITLEVNPSHKEQLEGTAITLSDGRGNVFLEGRIISGRVSQVVDRVKDVDLSRLSVKPKKEGVR